MIKSFQSDYLNSKIEEHSNFKGHSWVIMIHVAWKNGDSEVLSKSGQKIRENDLDGSCEILSKSDQSSEIGRNI